MPLSPIVARISEAALKSGVFGADKESLLTVWMDTDPSARSPYVLYGNPPMWATIDFGNGLVLFTRPGKTSVRLRPHDPHTEVDGVSCQFMFNGKWVGQGIIYTFESFETDGVMTYEVNKFLPGYTPSPVAITLDTNQETVINTLIKRGASMVAQITKEHWLRGEAYYMDTRLAARKGLVRMFEKGNKRAIFLKTAME